MTTQSYSDGNELLIISAHTRWG